MITTGIIGGSGYTAGELLRILIHHPEAKIDFVFSTTNAGKPIASVHTDLIGECDLTFAAEISPNVDVVFLCLGHGNSTKFLDEHQFSKHTKIIDLSQDFRLNTHANHKGKQFVYGLPETQKAAITTGNYIANPGCFASGIQFALLPLAKAQLLHEAVHINAITGSTGAGVGLKPSSHFSWRNNNVSIYKAFTHQHLGEIKQNLTHFQPDWQEPMHFIPVRGNFPRGIFTTAYTACSLAENELYELYNTFYKDCPFVHVSESPIHLKQIVNTNKCVLHLEKHNDLVLISSAIDNLLKGASGQAVQNMNLMFGLPETCGLTLKANAF